MKKFITTLLLALSLTTAGALVSSNTVSAAPKSTSSYWYHWRRVTVKKGTYAHKVKEAVPAYKDRLIAKKWLPKGTKVSVQNGGASWYWFVKGHGMHGMWVVNTRSSKWIK